MYGGANDTIGCGIKLPQNSNVRIWNNVMQEVYRHPTDTGPSQQTKNIVTKGGSSTDSTLADPQFVDRAAYRLKSTSPALNAGLSQSGTPDYDFDGFCRVGVTDIGAREFGGTDTSCGGGGTTTPPANPDFIVTGLTAGQSVSGGVTVQATPVSTTSVVFAYYLDGNLYRSEQTAPYCLGGDDGTACSAWDSHTLQNGSHALKIAMTPTGGAAVEKTITFTVANTLPGYIYPTPVYDPEFGSVYSGNASTVEDPSAARGGYIKF